MSIREDLVADAQRLSKKRLAGKLTHEEWKKALDSWNERVEKLPEDEQDDISLELFQHIEPEKS